MTSMAESCSSMERATPRTASAISWLDLATWSTPEAISSEEAACSSMVAAMD